MENNVKLERLKCTFPKLTEANQHYILGIAAGLKYAQKKNWKYRKGKAG